MSEEDRPVLLTESLLKEILAERGYRYEERPILGVPELAGEYQIYATRGEREAILLGSKGLIVGTSVEQYQRSWGYRRLGLSREDYLDLAATEIAGIIMRGPRTSMNVC